MINLRTRLVVRALRGTDLRREPNTNSKTEDGEDNVILSLPFGTYVLLESENIHTTDENQWALAQPENEPVTGWVIASDLSPEIEDAEAPDTTVHTFRFGNKTYKIFEDKRVAAVGRFIFETRLPGSRKVKISNRSYFTTQANIDAMKSTGWIQ